MQDLRSSSFFVASNLKLDKLVEFGSLSCTGLRTIVQASGLSIEQIMAVLNQCFVSLKS